MPIRTAQELKWSPSPRCPVCGVGVTASGRRQPFAVDDAGRVHCRTHGHLVASEYDETLTKYERMRQAQAELLRIASEEGVTPTKEELEEVRREWV